MATIEEDSPPKATRLAVIWDGDRWAEIDPVTGWCLAIGQKPVTKEVPADDGGGH